jgi:branched-chain amino acid transport system ATP-binding protein
MIGSNGAGKTTFVNMVTGYVKPSAGQILYQGRDITSLIPRAVTRIGITRSFQIPQVFLTASVQDNLLISLGVAERKLLEVWRPLRRADLAQVAFDMLKRYGIDEYSDQTAQLLPQGVRKLLDIAMAVVHGPKVLLLDEPTSGVAIEEKFGIMDTVMNALREQKVTVLFVEHDMEIVQRYATRVLAFYDGTIIADGAPDHVLSDAKVRQYVIGEELHRKGAQEGGHA